MKRIQNLFAAALLLGVFSIASAGKMTPQLGTAEAEAIDGIVAIVNSDIVTRSELNRQVVLIERQMSKSGKSLPDRTQLREQVLNRMVMDKAQLQLAREIGIRVEDAQIETAMNSIAEQNGMALPQFLERLHTEGVSATQFREEVRSEIILSRLREREVESKIQVSDAEIQAYISARTKSATGNKPEVNWIQLLVKTPNEASSTALNQAQAKVAELEKALRAGSTLDAILKTNPSLVIEGTGQMGWQDFDKVPSLFTNYLSTGEMGSVQTIRSANGFHVLKILARREGVTLLDSTPVTQTHVRHILIKPSLEVTEAEAQRRLAFVIEQLRSKQADFETLAKRYSQDGSANKGGDLGWLYPDDTVPEFEREMDKLNPGNVSPVFQTRFGFHVLQVVERRQQAASEERQRQNARQAIRASKSEENYQEWLRQLRDKTFIDLRL